MMKQYIKRHMRQALSLLIVGTMLCVLAACGKEESNVQISDSEHGEPEYLSFFSSQNMSESDLTKYWSERFMETYNRPVYIIFDGATYYADEGLSYRELLEKRLASSAPDDLYIINAEDVMAFEKRGYWMDLSEMDFVDNLSEAALSQSTYNEKVFSIPLAFTGFGFAWNVDMLAENGLSVPRNLEEFLAVCRQLKDAGILPYGANKGFALTVPAMAVGFAELYGSTDKEERTAALNSGTTPVSTYMRDGFEFLNQMIELGYLDPEQAMAATPRQEDLELFLSDGCAFVCATMNTLEEMKEASFEIELTGIPVLPEGSISIYGASDRLCVNPNSRHLNTALDFVEMIGTTEALEESAKVDKSMSSAKHANIEQFHSAQNLAGLLQQPGQIPNQDFALHFNTWESIRDAGREICGGASVEEACAMLDERQRTELEAYGTK